MPVISVRVSKDEKQWLSVMADFYGMPLSELLKNKSMSQIEDKYDALIGEKNYIDMIKNHQKPLTLKQAEEQLDKK